MKTENTPALVIQPELLMVAQESKIELTKAESYAVNYMPFMSQVNELSQPLKDLDKVNPTEAHAKTARENRLKLVKVRTAAEDQKKADKEMILIEGKLIDGLFNVVKNTASLTEAEYAEIERFRERKEAEEKESVKNARLSILETAGIEVDLKYVDIASMPQNVFDQFFEDQKTAVQARIEKERTAEAERIEAEKKAEEERKERERLEAERIEAQRLENEKLKAEAEKREAELVKERAEQKRLSDIAAKEAAELKSENDRIANELRKQKEEKDLADQQEKQRIETEEYEKLAKEKAALSAPDKEKVNALFLSIKAITIPDFATDEYKAIGKEVKSGIDIILKGIKDLSKGLK